MSNMSADENLELNDRGSVTQNRELIDKIESLSLSELVAVRDVANKQINLRVYLNEKRIPPFFRRIFDENAVCRKDLETAYVLATVEEVLATLTPREENVIRRRFGLGSYGRKFTLRDTGNHFGITGERVRQIEKEALKKLKHRARSRKLGKFLEKAVEPSRL